LQLPPVVASPAQVTAAPGGPRSQQQLHGLLRPLFVRLAALGVPPFLLRRQYRCHPAISAVPNQQFYGGRLLDGCTPEQRASLLPGLPSLAFLDVRGQEQYSAGGWRHLPVLHARSAALALHSHEGAAAAAHAVLPLLSSACPVPRPLPPAGRSTSNSQEAEAVVAAVERLVAAGVSLGQCGVICLFRAQVALVRSLLDRRLPQLEALQQRRRQQATAVERVGGGGGSASCEEAAAGPRRRQQDGEGGISDEEDDQQQQAQQGIQVATADSFQVGTAVRCHSVPRWRCHAWSNHS
jgi:superfamily I DNA and/or RNA helicase